MNRGRISKHDGTTLVELLVTIFIAGIAMTGLVTAYLSGINYWRSTFEEATITNEAGMVLDYIAGKIRAGSVIHITSNAGYSNSKMDILYFKPNDQNEAEQTTIEFYYLPEDQTLRMNDLSGSHGTFNKRILPMYYTGHNEPDNPPYLKVADMSFIQSDPVPPDDPAGEGSSLVTVNLSLVNTRGDTLKMSTTVCKRNAPS